MAAKKRAETKRAEPLASRQVQFRLTDEDMDKLDAIAEALPFGRATRANALRFAVEMAFDATRKAKSK